MYPPDYSGISYKYFIIIVQSVCKSNGKVSNLSLIHIWQTIVCLPHKVVVEIIKQNIVNENNDVDAVVK